MLRRSRRTYCREGDQNDVPDPQRHPHAALGASLISRPLRTSVIGSYPLPGWLELAGSNLERFGEADRSELYDDAVVACIHDQLRAGVDVITDGEQTRHDFNLSFYGYLGGIDLEESPARRFGPPAHDQRGLHQITGELCAPAGLGVVGEFERLQRLAPPGPALKVSVPGPYTLSGRIVPGGAYPDRWAVTEALLPIVQAELLAIADAGCAEIGIDEPSMSCYAYREDPERFVDIFNRTVAPLLGRCRLSTHLCFGNFRGRAVGLRRYAPMFPAFNALTVDEIHLEMASRELAELEIIASVGEVHDVVVGIVDVKTYYVESPEVIVERVQACLRHVPSERLGFAPDCGLSQTARWAAREKLANMVTGVRCVREEL